MSHAAGSVYVHCPQCAAEVEAEVQVVDVEVRATFGHLLVRVQEECKPGHQCFPAAVEQQRKGRRRTSQSGPW